MNGLQKTMGNLWASIRQPKLVIKDTVYMPVIRDTVRIPKHNEILRKSFRISSNPSDNYYSLQLGDTVYFHEKQPLKGKNANWADMVEYVKKSQVKLFDDIVKKFEHV